MKRLFLDWWQCWPRALPALPCRGFLVVDADRHPGGADGVAALHNLVPEHGEWPDHPVVITPSGGEHHFFRQPDPPLGNSVGEEQIATVKEVVDFYRETLLNFTDNYVFAEFCGRAVADVTHEVAAVRYGCESPEANAVFDEQDRHLTSWLRQLDALRAEQRPV